MFTMSKENRYIADELGKSGFPLEIETAEVLEKSGWEVLPSVFYYDYDDDTYKETDIIAYKTVAKGDKDTPYYPYHITVVLLIECKKRDDVAWVFFPRPRKENDIDYYGVGLASVDSFRVARLSNLLAGLVLPRHISFSIKPWVFLREDIAKQIWGITELNLIQARDFDCLAVSEKASFFDVVKLSKRVNGKFNRDSERKQIHSAVSGLAKATEDRLVQTADLLQVMLQSFVNLSSVNPIFYRLDLYYFFPLIILDGN